MCDVPRVIYFLISFAMFGDEGEKTKRVKTMLLFIAVSVTIPAYLSTLPGSSHECCTVLNSENSCVSVLESSSLVMTKLLVAVLEFLLIVGCFGFKWIPSEETYWAWGCKWSDTSIGNRSMPNGVQCSTECMKVKSCTHYDFRDQICALKSRSDVQRADAVPVKFTTKHPAICGIMDRAEKGAKLEN